MRQRNGFAFDTRAAALYAMPGQDLTRIHGMGPYLALKLVAECSNDMTRWPSAKHFTSWLCLAPGNKISGGKVLSSKTRRPDGQGHGGDGDCPQNCHIVLPRTAIWHGLFRPWSRLL